MKVNESETIILANRSFGRPTASRTFVGMLEEYNPNQRADQQAKGQPSGVIDANRFRVIPYFLLKMSAKIAYADDTNDPDECQRGINQRRRFRIPEYPRQSNEKPDRAKR